MSNNIQEQAREVQTSVFLKNLVKLIPVEIIALFAIIQGLIPATAAAASVWVVFGLLTLLVPFYVIFAMKVKKWDQVLLMTIAFPIWAIAIGGLPPLGLVVAWFEPWMVSVALALFTLVPPMFYGQRISENELEEKFPQSAPELTTQLRAQEIKSWREI